MSKVKTKKKTKKTEQAIIKANRNDQFDLQKNKLKKFSKQLPKNADLPVVPESSGLFGLFNYDVKGNDLNQLTDKIQDKMIEQNKLLVKVVKEFHTIYDTFSALDKEYIQGILNSLFAAEEANKKALKGIEGVRGNQQNIEKIINQQKQVINVLKGFKENIEKIKHIYDVDELYATFTPIPDNIKTIESNIGSQQQSINYLRNETQSLQVLLETLQKSTDEKFVSVEKSILNEKKDTENTIEENKKAFEAKQASLGEDIVQLSKESAKNFTSMNDHLQTIDEQIKENESNHAKSMGELKETFNHQMNDIRSLVDKEVGLLQKELNAHKGSIESLSESLKTTKIFSYISVTILFISVVLIISGVF